MREQWFKPLGLVTEPNKLGQYPVGAMSRADNCVMRAPGLLMSIDQPAALPGSMSSIAAVVHRAVTTGDQLIAWAKTTTGWDVWWQTLAGVTVMPFADTATPVTFAADGRISSSLFRRRTVFNSEIAPWVVDYTNPTTTAERTARWAGFPQPLLVIDALIPDGLAVAQNDVVTYAATLERRYPPGDDYVLISEPSPLVRCKQFGGGDVASVRLSVRFGTLNTGRHGVRVGDELKIWRSPPVPSDAAHLDTESGTTLYLATTVILSAADVTNGHVLVVDDAEPRSLAEELYTNPGQEGLDGARRPPPYSKTIASYQGFTFYGNCTTPGTWRARFPYGLGYIDQASGSDYDPGTRKRGIGARRFSGTATAGSGTISGISAENMAGLAVGQVVSGTGGSVVVSGTITAIGSGTIGVAPAATGSGTATAGLYAVDMVELDGVLHPIGDLQQFIASLIAQAPTTGLMYAIHTAQTIAYRELVSPAASFANMQLTYSQGMAVEPFRYVQNSAQLTVRATNGQNYDPPIPSMTEAAQTFYPKVEKNLAYWSWDQQPECVAPPNYTPVGAGEIYQCIRAGDALLFFCSDGLHRLSGYGTRSSGIGAQWRVDAVDRTLILLAPGLVCSLRDSVYAHTNRGLVELGNDGVRAELSAGIVGDLLRPAGHWTAEPFRTMAADDLNHEVWIQQGVVGSSLVYIYNTYQQAFTQIMRPSSTCLVYVDFLDAMGFAQAGAGARPTLLYYRGLAATTYENIIVDFQPTSANDPLHAKQWIDMTLVFAEVTGGAGVSARWNAVTGAARTRTQRPNDARANFGVPRSAPAVAATLAPGYQFSGSSLQLVLRGVSLRYEPLSEQYVHR